jgi:hypothetical protein
MRCASVAPYLAKAGAGDKSAGNKSAGNKGAGNKGERWPEADFWRDARSAIRSPRFGVILAAVAD